MNKLKLRPLLDAQSVAILGAVDVGDHARLASKPVANLRRYGFKGRIYPVNPNFKEVSGLPCFPSLAALPEVVDVVMVLRRAELAADTIREIGELGIPSAVVCGGGFAEIGGSGIHAQKELAEAAQARGIQMCGPNTNGILNFHTGMMLGFHPLIEQERLLPKGAVSIVSHSGTVCGAIMARLLGAEIGFAHVIGAGNEASLQAADYMEYLVTDENTKVVVLYLEQIQDGKRFGDACMKLRRAGKSIVALKAGASANAARVAFGHTGALVGSHSSFLAAARDYGIAVAHGLEELVALTRLASDAKPASSGIVGLSMSGGLCTLMADAAERSNISFCELDADTISRLRDVIPISNPTNPFDFTAVAVDKIGVLEAVLNTLSDGTKATEFVFSLGVMPAHIWPLWAKVCKDFTTRTGVRLSIYAAGGRSRDDGYSHFEKLGIGVYDSIEPLLRGLVSTSDVAKTLALGAESKIPQVSAGNKAIDVPGDIEGRRRLLADWDLPYVAHRFMDTRDQAVAAADAIGYPVALKIASEQVAHKAMYDLVALDLQSADDVSQAFERMENSFKSMSDTLGSNAPARFEVQGMLPRGGLEVFLGGRVDAAFGPIVSVGLGGGLVEAIADLNCARAPLDLTQARDLLDSSPSLKRALSGKRWDVQALVKIVSNFSAMLAALSSKLEEVEFNPVVVYKTGAVIVDDLWSLKERSGTDLQH